MGSCKSWRRCNAGFVSFRISKDFQSWNWTLRISMEALIWHILDWQMKRWNLLSRQTLPKKQERKQSWWTPGFGFRLPSSSKFCDRPSSNPTPKFVDLFDVSNIPNQAFHWISNYWLLNRYILVITVYRGTWKHQSNAVLYFTQIRCGVWRIIRSEVSSR